MKKTTKLLWVVSVVIALIGIAVTVTYFVTKYLKKKNEQDYLDSFDLDDVCDGDCDNCDVDCEVRDSKTAEEPCDAE